MDKYSEKFCCERSRNDEVTAGIVGLREGYFKLGNSRVSLCSNRNGTSMMQRKEGMTEEVKSLRTRMGSILKGGDVRAGQESKWKLMTEADINQLHSMFFPAGFFQ